MECVHGIVIYIKKYREKDLLVKLFTEEYGPIMFLARGAQMPSHALSSVKHPFAKGVFLGKINHNRLSYLNNLKEIELPMELYHDYLAYAYMTYWAQLLNAALDEGQPSQEMYRLFSELRTRVLGGADPEALSFLFELRLLPYFGICFDWQQCRFCAQRSGIFDFSSECSGLVCLQDFSKVSHRYHAHPNAIYLMRQLACLSLDDLGEIQLKDQTKRLVRSVIDQIYDEYVGIFVKGKQFLKKMDQDTQKIQSKD